MIRRRLTALVLALVSVTLAIYAIAVFAVTREAVQAEVRRDVTNRVGALAGAAGREPDALTVDYVNRFGSADMVAVIHDETGAVLARSATLLDRDVPFDRALFESGRAVELDVSGPLVVSGRPVTLADGRAGYAVIGRSPDRTYETLRTLAQVLLPATLVTLAVTGVGLHLLVRRSLGPLEQLGEEASAIASSADHEARICSPFRADEVGVLAEAVDSMLASLGEAHRRAEAASGHLRDFLADVSHELRSPLAVVTSSLDLLERAEHTDAADRDRLITGLRTEVDRMARIVSQLLVMARRGEEARAADRPLLLGEVARSAGHRWAACADASVDVDGLQPIADAVVQGNEDQLMQVLDVMLENAVRHTPPDGRIDLSGSIEGDIVTVALTDSGCGIAEDDLPRVFDRFHRGLDGGTGLGLAIAKHLVEAHGGSISAASTLGAGSRFTIALPLHTGGHEKNEVFSSHRGPRIPVDLP